MKYILIIFILASFLFSQAPVTNYENSIPQGEEINKNVRSMNPIPNNPGITQRLGSEDSNYNSQAEENNENSQSINPVPDNPGTTQKMERKDSNYDTETEQSVENDENNRPMNPQ